MMQYILKRVSYEEHVIHWYKSFDQKGLSADHVEYTRVIAAYKANMQAR